MKIIVLDTTTKTICAALSSAVATSNPDFVVAYADTSDNTFSELSSDGQLNGTTDVTLVGAPASGVKRTIKSISVYNRDTAPVIVVIKLDVSGTQRILQRVQLVSGETWHSDELTKLSPGGSDTQVQFNDSGTLAGSSGLVYNKTTSTLTLGANPVLSGGTANAVAYLNSSKVLTTGSVLTFDGAQLGVNGLTVGRGAGAVSTNTAVGAGALAANTSGSSNAAFGNNALLDNTSGAQLTALGQAALQSNTSGIDNTAVGFRALQLNTTGNYNTAVGRQALLSNTTASNNTAVGYQAGYSNTTGTHCTYVGNISGLYGTGSYNTGVGSRTYEAASFTGTDNCAIGYGAGNALTSGSFNTFLGRNAGAAVTTGGKNTIVGYYNGNQGGLDIRTASNYIVLSDGDGNPRLVGNGSGNFAFGGAPSAWGTLNAFQIGTAGFAGWPGTDYASISSNAYYTGSGGIWNYIINGYAARYSTSAGEHRFVSGGSGVAGNNISFTTLLTFDIGKSLALEGASPQTGTGITFPATQSASSNANTLDDYEEGTWTPTDASGAGLTFDTKYGYYIKVGKIVYVQAKIVYPTTASGANNSVGGLPFSMSNSNPYNFPVGACSANGNTYALRAYGTGNTFAFLNSSDGTSTNANLSAANINFNMTYIADS